MNARTAILERLTKQQKVQGHSDDLDYAVIKEKRWDDGRRLELLMQNMTAVNTEVIRSDKTNWVEQVKKISATKKIRNLLASPHTWCGERLHASSNMPELLAYEQPVEGWKTELFETVDASLTTTAGGIAETGSLVLWPDAHEPRLMSLVPPIHIAILEANAIEDTLWSFMKKHEWVEKGMPSNVLLISGPSKTADIEQTLAYGVHGPKELVVIII